MDFYEVVSRRRSIRHYADRPVSDESLRRIAHAVSLAPTACNRQAFKIQAVRNPEIRAAICAACPQRFLPEAPVILGSIMSTSTRPTKHWFWFTAVKSSNCKSYQIRACPRMKWLKKLQKLKENQTLVYQIFLRLSKTVAMDVLCV